MENMALVNLTPHSIHPVGMGVIEPADAGNPARVSMVSTEVLPGFFESVPGPVTELPNMESGRLYIVSAMVRTAVPDRPDLISPGESLRDEQGRVIGCKGFQVNPGFKAWVEDGVDLGY